MKAPCLLLLVLATSGTALGQSPAATTDVDLDISVAAPDLRRPPLFRVDHRGHRMYLLGSIHSLPSNALPMPPAVETAFAEAASVAFEVDLESISGGDPDLFRQVANEELLSDVGSKDLIDAVDIVLESHGLDIGLLDAVEPWYAALVLSGLELGRATADAPSNDADENSEPTIAPGVDQYFFERAPFENKTRVYLESVRDQFNAFDDLPLAEQLSYLGEVVAPTESTSYTDLYAAWASGDDKQILFTMAETTAFSPALKKALLGRRNRKWMPAIFEMLRQPGSTSMVIVGAAHLVGTDSVISLLRDAGYVATRL